MKNWIKLTLVSISLLGVGHCCKHNNTLTIKELKFLKSNNTLIASNNTPSVLAEKNGVDSTTIILNTLPQKDGYAELNWQLLAQTQFKPISVDSLEGLIVLFPTFPKVMKALEGKNVMMSGYVIPIEETGDSQTLVLSANSYTTCFFCGKAGPESIMDIRLKNPQKMRRFKQDEKVAFRGKLTLNDKDFDYFNYIIEDGEWVR
ncbi:MAG: hypothetical protein HC817_04305 [Saprospiraceae bacterium]|nr:hypothetical protein [Saprospiraceae bacterium]